MFAPIENMHVYACRSASPLESDCNRNFFEVDKITCLQNTQKLDLYQTSMASKWIKYNYEHFES